MTHQLTRSQIEQLRVVLNQVGLDIKKMPKPKAPSLKRELAAVKAWKPETPAGRACKSSMLYWASLPPIEGVKSYYCGPCYQRPDKGLSVSVEDSCYDKQSYHANALGGPWPQDIAAFYADKL